MITFALGALAAAAAMLGPRPRAAAVRARLHAHHPHRAVLRPSTTATSGAGEPIADDPTTGDPTTSRWRTEALAWTGALAGGLVCVVVAGSAGAMAAVVVVPLAAVVLRRQIARAPAQTDAESRAAVPLACDLIGAGLRSGAAVPTALSATARTAPAGLREELNRVAALLSLGTSAAEAWGALARDPVLGAVAVVAARSADSGIRLAEALSRCALSRREDLYAASVARAERVGVLALLPLGLCFLPAFICLGVVPVVAGIAADVFSRVAS